MGKEFHVSWTVLLILKHQSGLAVSITSDRQIKVTFLCDLNDLIC